MALTQPVKRGISAPVVTNVPEKWDREWFRSFITNYLQNTDIRNASTANGITVVQGGFSQPPTVTNQNIPLAAFTPIPSNTVVGNVTAGTASPVAINSTQLTALIAIFTPAVSGAVPASGGGTANFLRADGTWTAPAGSIAIPNNTVLGNVSGGTATPVAVDQAHLTALINVFTATLSGAVPLSGGGTTNFLRADGTWAAPAQPTGANPSGLIGLTAVNGVAVTFDRSDSTHALDQGIVPTWTGIHTFSARPAFNAGATVSGGTFISRGISDSATATALTIASTGAVSIAAPSSSNALTVTGNTTAVPQVVVSGLTGATSGATVDLRRANSSANTIGVGPDLTLTDTTATTASALQHAGGQTELWQTQNNGVTWDQIFKVLTTRGVVINAPASGVSLNVTAAQLQATVLNGAAGTNVFSSVIAATGQAAGMAVVAGGQTFAVSDGFMAQANGGDVLFGVRSNNQVLISTNGTNRITISGTGAVAFPSVGTTASAANAFLDNAASNNLLRSTSSIRYKTEVENLYPEIQDSVLKMRPVWYRSLAERDRKDWSWIGLIAEEVAAVEPRLVHWIQVPGGDGTWIPDAVQYERVAVALLGLVQRMHAAMVKAGIQI